MNDHKIKSNTEFEIVRGVNEWHNSAELLQPHDVSLDIISATAKASVANLVPAPLLAGRTEIVFIESNVADIDVLISAIGQGREIHILDASQDGLTQIADLLAGRTGIDALHLITHGKEASLNLGSLILDSHTLASHSAQLKTIGESISQNGDILLYGCDVGAGQGHTFVEQLALITGADIAASDNTTGAKALGGDWNLEVTQGQINAMPLVTPELINTYHQVLALSNVTVDFSKGYTEYGDQTGTATQDYGYKVNNGNTYILRADGADQATFISFMSKYTGTEAFQFGAINLGDTESKVTFKFDNNKVFTPSSITFLNTYANGSSVTAQTLYLQAYDSGGVVGSKQTISLGNTSLSSQTVTFSGGQPSAILPS